MADKGGNALLWRAWQPAYAFPLVYSCLAENGVGGTELQMLLHGRQLVDLGYRVQVLGAKKVDVVEDGVEFIGAADRAAQEQLIANGRVRPPELILLEGAYHAAEMLRARFPSAGIIHIGQNIDRGAARLAFAVSRWVDAFGFVGPGQLAHYAELYPRLRHQFLLIRNCVPWHSIYSKITPQPVREHVAWVGGWIKPGLRQWAQAMERILAEFPSLTWTLCGPSYGARMGSLPPETLHGLRLPPERITVKTLPLQALAREVSPARVVVVSLGGEAGPVSGLDAKAMGRPVLSGNDMVYQFSNPNGTGIRVTTLQECHAALRRLLADTALCDELGRAGRDWVLREFTETNQRVDLQDAIHFLKLKPALGPLATYASPSPMSERAILLQEKIKRKWARFRSRHAK